MDFIKSVMNHKTIREFEDKKVSDEHLKLVIDGLMRTASSSALQQASVIRITDVDKKKAIAKFCGQEFIGRFPEFFVFIVDLYRNERILKDHDKYEERESHVDKFLQGFTDAVLMAQNANNIIESLDMGAVFIGNILSDPQQMIEILNLPELTFPVLGLGFGYPNENPDLKPRIPTKYRLFENEYKIFDDYKNELAKYDEEISAYVDLRFPDKTLDPFSAQVIERNKITSPLRIKLLEVAKSNGFKL
ncbi:MAG: NADPH-dependent oxidoreductase [Tissierellia bacterium]|nr:NADPH-dependent oxidoreductase [Tissierellia bacterium]